MPTFNAFAFLGMIRKCLPNLAKWSFWGAILDNLVENPYRPADMVRRRKGPDAMNRNVTIVLINAAFAGAVGGYAVTQWGPIGALAGVLIAFLAGLYLRRNGR